MRYALFILLLMCYGLPVYAQDTAVKKCIVVRSIGTCDRCEGIIIYTESYSTNSNPSPFIKIQTPTGKTHYGYNALVSEKDMLILEKHILSIPPKVDSTRFAGHLVKEFSSYNISVYHNTSVIYSHDVVSGKESAPYMEELVNIADTKCKNDKLAGWLKRIVTE